MFDVVPPSAWGVVAGLPLSVAVRATTDLGDAQSARGYLAVPVSPAMFDTPFALPYLRSLGQYHLAMGHPQSALTYSQSCRELMARWHVDAVGVAAVIEWRDAAAAALIGLGALPRPARPGAGAPFPGDELCLFDIGEQPPRRWVTADANTSAGRRQRDPVGEAPDPADAARLTYAEQRVAALAAAGNTNRQIAEYLFITVSTVEQHLTKIYRKLNVRSRSGLHDYSN